MLTNGIVLHIHHGAVKELSHTFQHNPKRRAKRFGFNTHFFMCFWFLQAIFDCCKFPDRNNNAEFKKHNNITETYSQLEAGFARFSPAEPHVIIRVEPDEDDDDGDMDEDGFYRL
jgi:hypothetical protein